jgi:hypothetical protein
MHACRQLPLLCDHECSRYGVALAACLAGWLASTCMSIPSSACGPKQVPQGLHPTDPNSSTRLPFCDCSFFSSPSSLLFLLLLLRPLLLYLFTFSALLLFPLFCFKRDDIIPTNRLCLFFLLATFCLLLSFCSFPLHGLLLAVSNPLFASASSG